MANEGQAEISPAESLSTKPQVTLAQLFMFVFGTCVVLGIERWRLIPQTDNETFNLYCKVRLWLFAPLDGVSLASLILCFPRRSSAARNFLGEPGHWFLVIRGVSWCLGVGDELVRQSIGQAAFDALPEWVNA